MTRRLASTRLQQHLLEIEEVRALITERAHQLYVQRGAEPGKEMDDWLRAEKDILPLAPFIECALRDLASVGGRPTKPDVLCLGSKSTPAEPQRDSRNTIASCDLS
jgi:hypothetical protein